MSLWRAIFEPQCDETVLVTPGAAEISLQPSIEDDVTRVQGLDESVQAADEPWLQAADNIDPTIHQVTGTGRNTSNSHKPAGLPKAAFVAGLAGLFAVLGPVVIYVYMEAKNASTSRRNTAGYWRYYRSTAATGPGYNGGYSCGPYRAGASTNEHSVGTLYTSK